MIRKTALIPVLFDELERTSAQIIEHNELLISGNLSKESIKFTENYLDVLKRKKRIVKSEIADFLEGGL